MTKVLHQGYSYTTYSELEKSLAPRVNSLLIKAGDTTRSVRCRIREQANTYNSSGTAIIAESAETYKRDYEFHEFLINEKGIMKAKSIPDEQLDIDDVMNKGAEWFVVPFSKLGWKKPSNLNKLETSPDGDYEIRNHKLELRELASNYMKTCYEEWLGESPKERFNAGVLPSQLEVLYTTIADLDRGMRKFMWYFCPRGQKTKLSMILSLAIESKVTVIHSYVLSVFTSYINDCDSFAQTYDKFVIIDPATDSDWKNTFNFAMNSDKKILFLNSLCGSKDAFDNEDSVDFTDIAFQSDDQRTERLEFLKRQKLPILHIVEEADLGAHRKKQYEVMEPYVREDDVLIVQTGTNPERAVSNWKIESTVELLYTDLINDKLTQLGLEGKL